MDQHEHNIVILTGAGISKESGLDTFRDEGGIWSKVRIEDVATPDAFRRDPGRVQAFYNARRRPLLDEKIEPNAAHIALAELEQNWPKQNGGKVTIVTQNIDDLHEKAGSKNLIHMHGEILKARCLACGEITICEEDLGENDLCPACQSKNTRRPNVVWFGEMPMAMDEISKLLEDCRLFISIGTSGNVYPAAGFVQQARHNSETHTVELNLEPSEGATFFAETRYGAATDIIPNYVSELLTNGIYGKA